MLSHIPDGRLMLFGCDRAVNQSDFCPVWWEIWSPQREIWAIKQQTTHFSINNRPPRMILGAENKLSQFYFTFFQENKSAQPQHKLIVIRHVSQSSHARLHLRAVWVLMNNTELFIDAVEPLRLNKKLQTRKECSSETASKSPCGGAKWLSSE